MGILGWLLLAALIVISCGYFNSRKADLWGLKGVGTGAVLFVAFWWVLPILWAALKVAFVLAILALIGLAVWAAMRVLAKNAS